MTTDINPRREPWLIDDSEFYELESRHEQMEFLLRYAVLAPSAHNTQPWMFAIVEDGIEVFADYARGLPHTDPENRELLMSVGAAIFNLRVAAAHFGYESSVLYQRSDCDTPPAALVTLRETCGPDPELRRLFPAILRRRTNRHLFDARPIDTEALSSLCDLADEYPEFIHFLLPRDTARIAELVAQGDRVQMESRAVREELADWVRPSRTRAGDGICADGLGFPEVLSGAAAIVIRQIDLGELQARHDAALVGATSLLLVITAEDDRVSLLRAGELLERMLLTATLHGLQYSFMNQPIQVATLRHLLAPIVSAQHPPQLLLRIGYAPPITRPMPRREVAQVLQR